MTAEQLLMTGIGALATALSFVCRLLWIKVEACEVDRRGLHVFVQEIQKEQRDFLKQKTEVLAVALANNTAALAMNSRALEAIEMVHERGSNASNNPTPEGGKIHLNP